MHYILCNIVSLIAADVFHFSMRRCYRNKHWRFVWTKRHPEARVLDGKNNSDIIQYLTELLFVDISRILIVKVCLVLSGEGLS